MAQAHVHLAYAPRGVGVVYAVLWLAAGNDVAGWFIGARNGGQVASYFLLQDYYSSRETRFYRSLEDDVYGPWVDVRPSGDAPLPHPPPLSEELCHELVRLQDQFARHWLFFDGDPQAHGEAEALRARGIPVRHVNIRAERIDKLEPAAAVRHYDSPDADRNVLVYLSKRWPLDFEDER
ncbi:MAG TPA: hypothetical protein VMU47_00470 [Caldimonas sp.]|nr:hypothetical protein [Caldimonas sp.]